MANKEYIIKDLSSEQIDRISEIWLNDLPYNFKSIVGNDIIRNYLAKIFETKNILKKGIFKNSSLIGFVFFGKDRVIIKEIFIDNFILIIKSFFKYMILFRYKYLAFYFNVAIFLTLDLFYKNKKKSMSTELLIIVINKEFHRKNLGSKLINVSLEDNYFKNFKEITVITLKKISKILIFTKKIISNNLKKFMVEFI